MRIEDVVDIRSRIDLRVRPFFQKSPVHSKAVLIPYTFLEKHQEGPPKPVLPLNHLTLASIEYYPSAWSELHSARFPAV